MNKLRLFIALALIAAIALLLPGCASKTRVKSDLHISGAPDWVNKGTNILNDRNGRLFHGVGQAPEMDDQALQISTADNRARAEVARILTSYMDVVSDDYLSAAGKGKDASSEQMVSQQIHNLTKVNLSGARIIAHWRHKKTNTIYSLAELDMKDVKKTMDTVEDMNEDLRAYISTHGENVFDKMASGQ
ncbi:MAG: hypothetical protein JSW10_06455 [Pseudomonadota bacterium]|nr:MAG: hypothetical protein JSW10_06455 [Pseudomonadota bacterium]